MGKRWCLGGRWRREVRGYDCLARGGVDGLMAAVPLLVDAVPG